jgi:tetratricopeptide (TPR) repeat protein
MEYWMKLMNKRFVQRTCFCIFFFGTILMTGCFESRFRVEQLIREAVAQAENGDATAAVIKLEKLMKRHSGDARIAEGLAIAYEKRGNFLLAASYFLKAAKMSEDKRHLLLRCARNLVDADRKSDAVIRYKEYLSLFPDDAESWLSLGRLQRELGAVEDAVASLSRGVVLAPESRDTAPEQLMLGQLYLGIGELAQADYYLNQVVGKNPASTLMIAALTGLVESSIRQKEYALAGLFLNRLGSAYPETLSQDPVRQYSEIVVGRIGLVPQAEPAPVAAVEPAATPEVKQDEQLQPVPVDVTAPPEELVQGTLDLSGKIALSPRIHPAGGEYTGKVEVTLRSDHPDGTIHYTIDGSEPTAASEVYKAVILLDRSAAVKAVTIVPGKSMSLEAVARYTVRDPGSTVAETTPAGVVDTGVQAAVATGESTASTLPVQEPRRAWSGHLQRVRVINLLRFPCSREGIQ